MSKRKLDEHGNWRSKAVTFNMSPEEDELFERMVHISGLCKRDFIAAIIDYVNDQWAERQEEIVAETEKSLRAQIVAICVGYVCFLIESPTYRSILMLKDEEFDNRYHK